MSYLKSFSINRVLIILFLLFFGPILSLICLELPIYFSLEPSYGFPLAADAELLEKGFGVKAGVFTPASFPKGLQAGILGGYSLKPLITQDYDSTGNGQLQILSIGAYTGFSFLFPGNIVLTAGGEGGYFYGFLNNSETSANEGNPYLSAVFNISYPVIPWMSAGITARYDSYLGLYDELTAALTMGFSINRESELINRSLKLGKSKIEAQPNGGIELLKAEFGNVFPVFYKYYDENPIGKVGIRNLENLPLEDIELSFFIQKFMDNPKTSPQRYSIPVGEEIEIDIYGLFNDEIMGITEGTKVSALLNVNYKYKGNNYSSELIQTLSIENRNAMTWDDDMKATAFVTAKDPIIQSFAKNVASVVQSNPVRGLDRNMALAIAMHETLNIYGVQYTIDPFTPFTEFFNNAGAVDYLQFPKQTLEYGAGDCDDLSILYSALLEAVGVETAFITVPGHIYIAAALNISPEEAEKSFSQPEDFIIEDNKVWLPVEVTLRQGGFLESWRSGIRQWRNYMDSGKSKLLPIHEGWKTYEPVGFSGNPNIIFPDKTDIIRAFSKEGSAFIARELSPQISRINRARVNDSRITYNRLGILYARYGMIKEAAAEFDKVLSGSDYLPTLVNYGNLMFMEGNINVAGNYYKRALDLEPEQPTALLGAARVDYELENFGNSRKTYLKLKQVSPSLAARFDYLDMAGDDSARASAIEDLKDIMVWED